MAELSDEQWCLMHALKVAKDKGRPGISRAELLHSKTLPQAVSLRLVYQGLLMPRALVSLSEDEQTFYLTEKGEKMFSFRFGKASGGGLPDVIYLPAAVN